MYLRRDTFSKDDDDDNDRGIVRRAMTEESSNISHLSVAMTTEETDHMQTTAGNIMTSLTSIGGISFWRCAVIFIGVVGIAGNALILYALVASKQHKKHALIVNQNALDLFSSFFLVVNILMEIPHIRLTGVHGYWLCMILFSGNLYWIGTNGSMISLAIITIDRYLKIVYPTKSSKWLRPWVRYSAIAFSWFVGIVYNTIVSFLTSAVKDGVCYGYMIFDSYAARVASCIVNVSFFYFLIIAIFIFCYGRILMAIRRQAKIMASHNTTGSNTAQTQSKQIQTNVIKTMIVVSAFYAIAWLPGNVQFLILSTELVHIPPGSSIFYVTAFISFLYTTANPFIYATKFNPVKEVLRKMIPFKTSGTQVQPTDVPVDT